MNTSISCQRSRSFFWGIVALATISSGIACNQATDPLLDILDTQLSKYKIDSLSRTMNFVVSPERFQKTQFEEKLAAALNRWANAESDLMSPEEWKIDSMTKPLLEQYASVPVAREMEGLSFVNTDSYFLQQNFWAKKLGERLVAVKELGPFEVYRVHSGVDEFGDEDEDVDPLSAIMAEIHDDLKPDKAESLAKALKLFDWVVRNIHLLPDDDTSAGADSLEEFRLNDAEQLPAAGVPGLGYTRFPSHTLLFSRGDYVERAKVFMTLLNQQNIDSVMLIPTSGESKNRPWAVGVNIDGKLYLFDTKLGLAIPGSATGSIATLTEAKSIPEILDSLDLSVDESLKDDTSYWVKSKQLDSVEGLIYASPESLSYRFWELENKLVGETRMNLVIEPTKMVEGMPKIEGLDYGIWDIEFQTHQFRRALRDAIAAASFKDDIRDKISWYFRDEVYINEFVRYRTARSKYFNGLFDTIRNDGNLNAIELFYSMIYKDSKIDSLASDKVFQIQLAVNQGDQSSEQFKNSILGVQQNMRLVRRDSGFFLSQCHFDNGNFSTAANWLTRLEQIENTERWQPSINYLRARSLEAQRDYNSAIQIYDKQESEQFHGDLVRARMLKSMLARAQSSNTGNPNEVEEKNVDDPNPDKIDE